MLTFLACQPVSRTFVVPDKAGVSHGLLMSRFLLSFGGIQKGGIHIPHLNPTLPWEQRCLAPFLHGHCKLHAELSGRWWGAVPSQGCTVSVEAGHMDT